ncbi:MAG: pentapeptide repeat-containing protein, partial [Actinomycetes bacterium]
YILGPNVNPREDMTVPLDLGSAPDLRGILLAGANLGKVKYTGVNFVFGPATAAFNYKAIPTPDGLAYLAGPGANLSGAHINCAAGNRVTWLEKKMKTKYNLNIGPSNSFFESGAGGSLEGVNFRGATIENCSFSGLNLTNSNWTEATVKNGRFNGTVFDGADLSNSDFTESDFIAVADLTNVAHMEGIKTVLSGLEVWSKVSNWWKDSSQVEQPGNLFAHLIDCGSGGFGSPVLSAITCGGISLPTLPGTTWSNRMDPPWKVTHINSAAERLLDLAATILGAYTGDVFQIIDALTKQGMSLAGPAPAPTNVKALPVMGDYCTGECANTSRVNQRVARVYFSEPKLAFPAVDKYVVVSCSDERLRRGNPRCGYVGEGTSSPILFSTSPGVQEIRVYSVNAQGGGPLSDPSQISLYAPPMEPNYSNLVVSGRDDSTLKFRISDFDPEAKSEFLARAAIKRFDVTATGGGSTLKTTVKVNPSTTSVVGTLEGAVVGRRYTVTATATDVVGQTGKPSRPFRSRWNEESIVKMTAPGPVSDIAVVSSGGRQATADGDPVYCPEMSPYFAGRSAPCAYATLSFRQATDGGGADISRYVVSAIDLTDPTQPPITWCRTSTELGPDCRAQQNA